MFTLIFTCNCLEYFSDIDDDVLEFNNLGIIYGSRNNYFSKNCFIDIINNKNVQNNIYLTLTYLNRSANLNK